MHLSPHPTRLCGTGFTAPQNITSLPSSKALWAQHGGQYAQPVGAAPRVRFQADWVPELIAGVLELMCSLPFSFSREKPEVQKPKAPTQKKPLAPPQGEDLSEVKTQLKAALKKPGLNPEQRLTLEQALRNLEVSPK